VLEDQYGNVVNENMGAHDWLILFFIIFF
jgi:hypothetical protein